MSPKESLKRFIVYADECYHRSWIYPQTTRKIVDYLTSDERKGKKFEVLNADNLREWMNSTIENNTAKETVVVFAQDMVPEPIAPDFSPSIILRTYLDSGGRIVWLGDVPFFRQGKAVKHSSKSSEEEIESKSKSWTEWGIGGAFSILGINVEFNYSPIEKVEITSTGKQWGLNEKNKWYGTRPIAEADDTIKILAESSARRFKPPELLKPEEKKSVFDTLSETTNKISILSGILISFITALFAFYSVLGQYKLPEWLAPILFVVIFVALSLFSASLPKIHEKYKNWRRKKYPNAWIKNCNKEFPDSGFVRLWDQQLYDVKEDDLKDLFAVATYKL